MHGLVTSPDTLCQGTQWDKAARLKPSECMSVSGSLHTVSVVISYAYLGGSNPSSDTFMPALCWLFY